MKILRYFLDSNGRTGVIGVWLVLIVTVTTMYILYPAPGPDARNITNSELIVFVVCMYLFNVAIVRRFHDFGLSLEEVLFRYRNKKQANGGRSGMIFLFKKGDTRGNQYGEPPLL